MEESLSDSNTLAFDIASILADHKAADVVVLDLRGVAGWTDYFVIGTSISITHLRGLARFVDERVSLAKIGSINKPAVNDDQSWILLDLGDVIVHIMNRDAREFYELEKLWFRAVPHKIEPSPEASLTQD
jgi:ribosome-associated protein